MKTQQHQTLPLIFAAVLAIAATGCGVEADPSLTAADCPQAGDLLSGRWTGTWQSLGRGTRAIQAEFVSRGDGQYSARYVSPIGGVIPRTHELAHAATRDGDEVRFSGTMSCDALLKAGTRFDAWSDGVILVINYQSGCDFGVLRLRRAETKRERGMPQVLADTISNLAG